VNEAWRDTGWSSGGNYSGPVSVQEDHLRRPSALDLAVFFDELVLLTVLAVAGALLGGAAGPAIILAIVFPLATAVAWGVSLAPRARRRLAGPARTAVKLVLFTIAAGLLAAAGPVLWAVLFWVLSVLLLAAVEWSSRCPAPRPASVGRPHVHRDLHNGIPE
jgi:hypothetical protein